MKFICAVSISGPAAVYDMAYILPLSGVFALGAVPVKNRPHSLPLSLTGAKFVLFYPETFVVVWALPEEMCQLVVTDLYQSQS